MSFTRRQFLLSTAGAGIGAIIPSFYYRALEFFEQFEKPLLVQPKRFSQDLCVLHNYDHLELHLGDPFEEPPAMSFREFFTRYEPDGFDTFEENTGLEWADLDLVTDSNMVSMWRYARPHDEVSISLLQQRLNDLDTGIRVVTGYAV